jgi:hypothetical protein
MGGLSLALWQYAARPMETPAAPLEVDDDPAISFEPRWPMRLALVAAIVLYATLPDRVLIPGSRYVVSALELALLAVLAALSPSRHHSTLPHVRAMAMVLVGLVSASNIATLVLLSHELVTGATAGGRDLVIAAIQIWLTNVIAFGFWYWELDRGGPVARMRPLREHAPPDFLFAQMATPEWAPQRWRPLFVDYLYVSFTNATAFSPTDTMPLTVPAKILMAVQSAASLITVALVAARAVNILT